MMSSSLGHRVHGRPHVACPGLGRSCRLAWARPRSAAAAAGPGGGGGGSNSSSSWLERRITVWPLETPVPMRAYVVVEAVVAVGTLGLVDAAFSGDWSRIGVISTDTEDVLKLLVYFVAAAHSCTAVAAAFAAQKQGSNPGIALVKGFVFGSLGLYEVMQGGGAPAQDDRSMEEQ